MTGILLGVLSACVWGIAGVTGSLAARMVGPWRVMGWATLLGMVLAVPLAVASGAPGRVDPRMGLWILLIAGCMLGGMFFVYRGVRYGSISVVAPISATYGGVAAVIAIATGEPATALAVGALALAVVGAILASSGSAATPGEAYSNQRMAAAMAGLAALLWGLQLWAGGQVEDDIGAGWLVTLTRLIGIIVIAIPLMARGEFRIPRKALPLVLVAGCGEVAGFTLFLVDSEYGIAQAAVLTGQYGTVAALIGVLVLKERLRGIQYVGLAVIIVAIVGLSLT